MLDYTYELYVNLRFKFNFFQFFSFFYFTKSCYRAIVMISRRLMMANQSVSID